MPTLAPPVDALISRPDFERELFKASPKIIKENKKINFSGERIAVKDVKVVIFFNFVKIQASNCGA